MPVDGGYVDWDRLEGGVEGPRARQDVATQVSVVAFAAVEPSRRNGPCRGKPGGGSEKRDAQFEMHMEDGVGAVWLSVVWMDRKSQTDKDMLIDDGTGSWLL